MTLDKIASAIYNDVVAGLSGYNANPNISMEQLEDEVVEMRNTVIKEFYLKNLIKIEDLELAINCIECDCKDPSKCCKNPTSKTAIHFEIPPLVESLGDDAIVYIGSTDRQNKFRVYMDPNSLSFAKYRKRGADKPYVYIEKTPNENGMYDGWVFNAPFIKRLSVIGIFRDLRQVQQYNCCQSSDYTDFGAISNEVKDRLTKKKLQYYRQFAPQPHPTDGIAR